LSAPSSSLTRFLAVVASASLALALVCAFGWWRAAHGGRLALDTLGPEERQVVLDELIAASPGVFVPAHFEPAVGYTLRRGRTLTAWGDTFEVNEIGYRTASLAKGKPEGAFRVVFLGDSWTFGMGVSEAESFPERFQELARQLGAGQNRRVEAVSLALPGYNTANQIAALDYFWERVRPDVVVVCPTSNDADSTANILPNGSLTRQGVERDAFGEDHSLVFRPRLVDSFKFRSRWRANFRALRDLEQRLRAREVPLVLFFAATWDEPFAHALVRESGLAARYVVTPRPLASPAWRNPEWGHGNAAANRLYAHMVYKGVAETLGWPVAPAPDVDGADPPVWHPERAAVEDWIARADELLAQATEEIPEGYTPRPGIEKMCAGPMDCATGLAGKTTTVLIRRLPGRTRLAVTLRRLPDAPSLDPLPVRVSIASPAGEVTAAVTLTADGPAERRVELALPADIRPGAALDVTVRAARAVSGPKTPAPRSLYITAIEQMK
jgi:hypothetical protein